MYIIIKKEKIFYRIFLLDLYYFFLIYCIIIVLVTELNLEESESFVAV